MVRGRAGKGLVRIGQEKGTTLEPENAPPVTDATVYPIWVIGPEGGITDEFVVTPLEPARYEVVAQLYREARAKAGEGSKFLRTLIESLQSQ